MSKRFEGIFGPLQTPVYRRLLLSNVLWWQTLSMWGMVAGWLMLEMTDSAWSVALLSFWRRTAQLSLGFFAGPASDRLGRRNTIFATQSLILLVCICLFLFYWTERLSPWLLTTAAFLIGILWTIDAPARTSLTPDLAGKTKIMDATLLENFVQNLVISIGPFVTGWLLARFGPAVCFLSLVGMSALNVALLYLLARQTVVRATPVVSTPVWQAIKQGVRYVRASQPILAITVVSAILNTLIFPSLSLMPVFARDVLQQGPVGLGLLNASYSIGTLAGLFLLNQIRHRVNSGWLFTMGTLLECSTVLIFALSGLYPLSLLMLFLAGLGHAGFNAMRSSILLTTASDEMRGRAMSTIVLTQGAGLPGELQSGLLADQLGAPMTVSLQASVALIGAGAVLIALPGLRRAAPERQPIV